MASKIQIRRDTASNWTTANPTLSTGELGLETDTRKLKAGDGSTAWSSLAYYSLGTTGYASYSDTTANFTGTLQEGGSNVVTASELGTNVATFLATPSSANLAGAVTNETGSGALVFGTSPTLSAPVITSGSINNTPIGASTPNTGAFTSVTVDNITIDGQAVKSTNTNGNVQLLANGTGYIELYGNTNPGALRFNCESNTHGVTLKGPAHSATATYSLELPDADGSSGQYLKTNGSGKLSFGAVAAGASLGANTFTGTQNFADNILQRGNLLDYGEITNALGNGWGTRNLDLTLGNSVTAQSSNYAATWNFNNPTASDELCGFTLTLTNGGSQTQTWPSSVDWAGGAAPTLTASGVDVLVFYTQTGGTIWYGFLSGAAMA